MKNKKSAPETVKKNNTSKKEPKSDLKVCTTAPHAEMVRNTDKDEPCDDGRKG